MSSILLGIQENAGWLLGSGGLAALVLGMAKLIKDRRSGPQGDLNVGGDLVSGSKTTTTTINRNGFGPIEFGIGIALILAAVGGILLVASSGAAEGSEQAGTQMDFSAPVGQNCVSSGGSGTVNCTTEAPRIQQSGGGVVIQGVGTMHTGDIVGGPKTEIIISQ